MRSVLEPAELVLQEDLESLRRFYSEEERVELWNVVRRGYKDFIVKCSTRMRRDDAALVKGKYKLAMLMLAASFRLNGEGQESIISMFREEEYSILLDFEEFKIFDHLDVDEIVEFIKRREGKVYELVKRYYDKQYGALDARWGPLIGDLVKAIEARYRARRRKIEEAVVEYARRYGLLETVGEIEEAVKRVLEAGEFRRRLEEELRRKILEEYRVDEMKERLAVLEEERERLLEALKRIEDSALAGASEAKALAVELERVRAEKEKLAEMYREVSSRLAGVERELEEARRRLAEKEEELRRLAEKYRGRAEAVEALNAEAETLRSLVERLRGEAEEYKRMLEAVSREKSVLEDRLREVEAALRGETGGRLVTGEEAVALASAYLERVLYKASPPRGRVLVYDPRRGGVVAVARWDEKNVFVHGEGGGPSTRSLVLVKKRGVVFKRPDVVVEVVVRLHEESYKSKGYDVKPVSLGEVVEIIGPRVERAEREDYYQVLVVASPTGFTEKAVEYVAGSEAYRRFASRNTSLYLVDLATGEVYLNRGDKASAENAGLVEPELEEEKIRKVIDYIMSPETLATAMATSHRSPMLLAGEVAKATGVDDQGVVRAAMARLERDGWGRVVYVKDRGVVAFRYSSKAIERLGSSL